MTTSDAVKPDLREDAVQGLIPGMVAGVVMGAYLVIVGGLAGEGPGQVFSRFGADSVTPALGFLAHMGVATFYGALYAGLRSRVAVHWHWFTYGLAYALVLFLASTFVILPTAGSPLREFSMLNWGIAHGLYGLALAWTYYRSSLVEE